MKMNKVENGVIKYQIDFEKYKNGQASEILAVLDESNAALSKFLKKTKDVYLKARYKEIAKKVKEVSAALKKKVEDGVDIDAVIDYELKKDKRLLKFAKEYIKAGKDLTVNFVYPSTEQIKTSALFKPIEKGFTYQSYLDGIEAGFYNVWDSAVRTGYLTGMTTNGIVASVVGQAPTKGKLSEPGAMASFRNSVYANTRTVLQSFANETRKRVFEANEKYFGDTAPDGKTYKYEYMATLDTRTCLVCGADDGKLFNSLSDKNTPQIPRHRGCRCVIVPYFNIDDERASKYGYVNKITFEDWLADQTDTVQKDVLGKSRYDLFKKGEPIEQFVDNGRTLTLKELHKRLGEE